LKEACDIADGDGDATFHEFHGPRDQALALLEGQEVVFLRFHACGHDQRGVASGDDVVDLPLERALVDAKAGRERGQRRHEQPRQVHWQIHGVSVLARSRGAGKVGHKGRLARLFGSAMQLSRSIGEG